MPEAPRRKPPASPDRRKLLVAGAYAAVNAAVVAGLGRHGGGDKAEAKPRAKGPTTPGTVAGAPTVPPDDHVYDLVIKGGRVVDPDSGYDRIANVGIDGATISSISEGTLKGRSSIAAAGKIVAPGFIDLLSYEPADKGATFKIEDGVTTNLGMHGLNSHAKDFFDLYTNNCLVNFGGAFDEPWMRSEVVGLGVDEKPSSYQIGQLADLARQELPQGWIGVDFEPEYAPGTTFEEMVAMAKVAKEFDVPCFFHGRYSAVGTNAATLDEIINVGKESGAAVHVEHIISTGGTFDMAASLARVEKARNEGHDVTACMYPYNYWATYIQSPRFAPGWQERFRITYGDLQVAGTVDRLTEYTFNTYRDSGDVADNKLTAAYAIPEADVDTCIQCPWVMIGSDAIITTGNNHPRATGCFSRTLGVYAREKKLISMHEAIGKMTILPARRLEKTVPALRKKGRIQRGADADITIFDPATVIDRSTVARPAVASAGIDYVLIAGQVVKDPDGLDSSKKLGQPITGVF
ncbi:MAG: amidohydrolase family protein [Acidimicrobiia bacterium]|nr:amidohydrolase family protein [Acidimicrobiia bacterium]